MWNRPQILDRFQKSLASIAVLIVLLGFAYKTPWIPTCIFSILLLHVIGIILYLSLPWDSWDWQAKSDSAKESFHRWSKRAHTTIVLALFVSPAICVGIAFGVGWFPPYVDETFQQPFLDSSPTPSLTNEYFHATLRSTNTTTFVNSFIGTAKERQITLLPTQSVIRSMLEPLARSYVSKLALPVAEGIGCAFILLFLFEKFVRISNENK